MVRIAASAWSLGVDAAAVIASTTAKIAIGGTAALTEDQRMINGKIAAASALQVMVMTGPLGFPRPVAATRAIAHDRPKVRANRKRLLQK